MVWDASESVTKIRSCQSMDSALGYISRRCTCDRRRGHSWSLRSDLTAATLALLYLCKGARIAGINEAVVKSSQKNIFGFFTNGENF